MIKANPKMIGAFVLGAIALLVVGLLMFGAGGFLREGRVVVSFFEGSVVGLSVGAPVTFRGVPVGTVTATEVMIDRETLSARIPVYYELEWDRITWDGDPSLEIDEWLDQAVQNGLRAQLVQESLVTGQLAIQLIFIPGSPIELADADAAVPEIPTIPSDIEAIRSTLQELPVADLMASATLALDQLNDLLTSPETRELLVTLNATLQEIDGLAEDLRTRLPPLIAEVEQASAAAQETAQQGQELLRRMEAVSIAAEGALQEAEGAFASADTLLDEQGPAYRNLQSTLREVEAAAQSVRRLAELIERNPSVLFTGRR